MPTCNGCGTTILFGGVTDGNKRYCKEACRANDTVAQVGSQIPDDVVDQHARHLHQGPCPRCQGPGPVDVYFSHQAMSFLILTQWKSNAHICCRRCASKSQWGAIGLTAVAGWWGFPWGLIMTPIQIVKNFSGMGVGPNPLTPSAQLRDHVRDMLAIHVLQQPPEAPNAAPPPLPRG